MEYDITWFNMTPPDKWQSDDKQKANKFLIDGKDAAEWIAEGKELGEERTYPQFYTKRSEKISNNADMILKQPVRSIPVEDVLFAEKTDIFDTINDLNSKSIEQVLNAGDALTRYADIYDNGGIIYGFDTETIGDTQHGTGEFAITEIGLGKRTYKTGEKPVMEGYSYAFGLNENQRKYMQSLLDRYKAQGWDSLNSTEQSSLQRASMYGWSADWNQVFENRIASVDGLPNAQGTYTFVKKIEAPSLNVTRMQQGINNLSIKGSSRNDFKIDIKDFLQEFSAWVDNNDNVFYGANSNYDISTLSNVMKQVGISNKDIEIVKDMSNSTVDVVYIARMLGTINGVSANSYMESLYGVRAGASVDEQMKALLIKAIQEHQAYYDTGNEGHVADRLRAAKSEKYQNFDTLLEIVKDYKENGYSYDTLKDRIGYFENNIDDTLFFIKKGTLNKENADEFAYVHGERVEPNYSITNEFWKIDTEHTGYFENVSSEQGNYRLTLENYAEKVDKSIEEPTRIVLTGRNADEVQTRLANMSNVFTTKEISPETAIAQQKAKRLDLARREFDRLFSVNDIRYDKGKLVNGYDELKSYMQMETDILSFLANDAEKILENEPKLLQRVQDFGKAFVDTSLGYNDGIMTEDILMVLSHMGDKGTQYRKQLLNSDYKLEAYRAMHFTLFNEREFLNDIIARVDNTTDLGLKTNIERTKYASTLYNKGIEVIDKELKKRGLKGNNIKFNMSDVFGIDIKTAKGNKRINGYSAETIANDLSNIFKGVSNGTNLSSIEEIILDMRDRKIIDPKNELRYLNILRNVDVSSSTGLSQSLYALSQDMSIDLYETNIAPYVYKAEAQKKDIVKVFTNDVVKENGRINSTKNLTFTNLETTERIQKFYEGQGIKKVGKGKRKKTQKEKIVNTTVSFSDYFNNANTLNNIDKKPIETAWYGEQVKFGTKHNNYVHSFEGKEFDTFVDKLLYSMNIVRVTEDDDKTYKRIISDMFIAEGKDGQPRPYAMEQYFKDHGLQAVIVTPDETTKTSAFMFLTTREDVGNLYNELSNLDTKAFESYTAMKDSKAAQYGAVFELPRINKYAVKLDENGEVEKSINMISQGAIEKIIVPKARTETFTKEYSNGITKTITNTYLNSAEYEVLSSFRQYASNAIPKVLERDYDRASRTGRKWFNKWMEELPTSSNYRGKDYTIHHGPADYIMAHVVDIGDGINDLFKRAVQGVEEINEHNMNTAQGIVYAFGKAHEIEMYNNETLPHYFNRILNNEEFKEWFNKRRFNGSPLQDTLEMSGLDMHGKLAEISQKQGISIDEYKKDIPHILRDIIDADVKMEWQKNKNGFYPKYYDGKMFGGYARAFIDNDNIFGEKVHLEPVLTESATNKGYVAVGVSPASYSYGSTLNSNLRPLFQQQNNGLPFNKSDIDLSEFTGAFEGSISVGHTTLERGEYEARRALLEHDKINVGERDFVIKTKEMNIYDLNRRWMTLEDITSNEAQSVINTVRSKNNLNGIDIDTIYSKAVEFMKNDISSTHEDKVFIAPVLKKQRLFQDRDAIKLELNMDTMNGVLTKQRLLDLARNDGYIDRDTVIGLTKTNKPVFYTGSRAQITEEDVGVLLDTGKVRLNTPVGDIVDDKMIFNGSEKATVHSIDIDTFIKRIGLNPDNSFQRSIGETLANELFASVSDGALAISSFSFGKHGEQPGWDSVYNIINSRYMKYAKDNADRGVLEDLGNYLNSLIKEKDVQYQVHPTEYRFISDTIKTRNLASIIETLYTNLKKSVENPETSDVFFSRYYNLNESIVEELKNMREKDLLATRTQRQNMNEHMGKVLFIDQRMRQSIVTRGLNRGEIGLQEVDKKYIDMIEKYSKNYDSKSLSLAEYGSLQAYVNKYGSAWNDSRLKYAKRQDNMKRTIHGVVETINYFNNPDSLKDLEKRAIVRVDINELLDNLHMPKNGVDSTDLQSTLFYMDGKPSEWLQTKINEQGIYTKTPRGGYSIFIDTSGFDVTINNKRANGFLIPVHSIDSVVDDKRFFQNSQSTTVKFINDIVSYVKQQKKDKNGKLPGKDIGKVLSDRYGDYIKDLKPELRYLKKDSDIYKSFQRFAMPTSQELMGQDETSSLLISQLGDDELAELAQRKYSLQKKLADQSNMSAQDLDTVIKELNEVTEQLNGQFKTLADEIRNDTDRASRIFDNFATIHDKTLAEANTVTIHGKKYHGMGIAVSEEALERQGLNLGVLAMDIIADFVDEKGTRLFDGSALPEFDKFLNNHSPADIIGKMNKIDESLAKEFGNKYRSATGNNVLEKLNNFLEDSEMDKKGWITTKDVNNAIANGDKASRVMKIFKNSGLAQDYMHEIGMFGDFQRFPAFRGQPSVKIFLDPNMRGYQFRSLNPVLSMLSKLDFDGDKAFLMGMLDGMSVLKESSNKDSAYQIQKTIYERFISEDAEGLLADLIEDGTAFKKEDPYAVIMHQAQLLKIFDDNEYQQGLEDFAKAHNYNVEDFKKGSALLYAAENSSEMATRFKTRDFNVVMDYQSRVAAVAARIRKKNIGYISTPNYMMRETLLQFMNNSATPQDKKELAATTYELLTNMFSEEGGLFDLIEQKAIDTKHAKDGLKVVKTTRWATNIKALMESGGKNKEYDRRYLTNMLESIENILGFKNKVEIAQYVDVIMHSNMSNIDDMIDNIDDSSVRNAVKSLTGLYELIRETNISDIYNTYVSDKAIDSLTKQLNSMTKEELKALRENNAYTGLSKDIIDTIANSRSEQVDPYQLYGIYYRSGDFLGNKDELVSNPSPKVHVYVGDGFKELDLNDFTLSSETLDHIPLPDNMGKATIAYDDFISDETVQKELQREIKTIRAEKSLNAMVFKDDKIRFQEPAGFANMIKHPDKEYVTKVVNSFGPNWQAFLNQLFYTGAKISKNDKGNYTSSFYTNIREYANAYDALVINSNINSTMPKDSADLIRQLNKSIAEHPEDYIDRGFADSYDKHLKNFMLQYFGSNPEIAERQFNNYIAIGKHIENIDTKKFNQTLEHLYNNTYNINRETQEINSIFANLDDIIKHLQSENYTEEELKPLTDIYTNRNTATNDMIRSLKDTNDTVIRDTQKEIYSMFKGDTNKFDTMFGFNGINGDAKMRVGFGEYMGVSFSDLSILDKQNILDSVEHAREISNNDIVSKHAIDITEANLKGYKTTDVISNIDIMRMRSADTVSAYKKNIEEIYNTITYDKGRKVAEEFMQQGAQQTTTSAAAQAAASGASSATKTMSGSKKTLSGLFLENASNFFKENKYTVGVGTAALVVLGVVNNLLHHDKTQSPLMPARTSDDNNEPYYNNGAEHKEEKKYAPVSPNKRVIYHDGSSGFNFKISGRTQNAIDARNQAKLLSRAGASNPTVYSQADMSGVSDNWLQNEFARLV